jgi:hypothetical protein
VVVATAATAGWERLQHVLEGDERYIFYNDADGGPS